jgi:hypothetical protein
LIAKISKGDNSVLLFSFRSTVNNIGVAVGSAIGGLFLGVGSEKFFLAAAISQLFALVLLYKTDLSEQLQIDSNVERHKTVTIKFALKYVSKKPVFWFVSILYA